LGCSPPCTHALAVGGRGTRPHASGLRRLGGAHRHEQAEQRSVEAIGFTPESEIETAPPLGGEVAYLRVTVDTA
jgi:hypothetical protein